MCSIAMTILNDGRPGLLLSCHTEAGKDSSRIRIVVIDDHKITLDGLVAGLSFEADMSVVGFATEYSSGFPLVLKLQPDVVLLDLHLPDAPGPRTMVKRFCQA